MQTTALDIMTHNNSTYLILFLASLAISLQYCAVPSYSSDAKPVDHIIWDSLVKEYVTEDGWVDYAAFMLDTARLQRYLDLLRTHHPNEKHWSNAQRKAYWINAYNAFTVELILKHYPVESIKDIKSGITFVNTVWDIKFIEIEGQTYDLNNLEHGILRKRWSDPRIHFALNCASYSCPRLRNEAFMADQLDSQLDDASRQFLNDPRRNKISTDKLDLCKIFSWYSVDFPNGDKFIDFLNQFTNISISKQATIDYMDYDWSLNDVR